MAVSAIALFCGGERGVAGVPDVDFSNARNSEGPDIFSDDGVVTLNWKIDSGVEFTPEPAAEPKARETLTVEVQQAATAEFTDPVRRYQGKDEATVLTGFPEGTYYFRLRALDTAGNTGAWSPPFSVKVEFMDRSHLILLLVIGGIVVAATGGAIITGHLRQTPDESS